jgi:Domain of unknown function (DUF4279)
MRLKEQVRSAAKLRVRGEDLIPDEVTHYLSYEPTKAYCKGSVIRDEMTGNERIARTGVWYLDAEEQDPADLNRQVVEILGHLNPDPEVWATLSKKFSVDLFCGLFVTGGWGIAALSPAALMSLGSRGIELTFDMYIQRDDADGEEASSNILH